MKKRYLPPRAVTIPFCCGMNLSASAQISDSDTDNIGKDKFGTVSDL